MNDEPSVPADKPRERVSDEKVSLIVGELPQDVVEAIEAARYGAAASRRPTRR